MPLYDDKTFNYQLYSDKYLNPKAEKVCINLHFQHTRITKIRQLIQIQVQKTQACREKKKRAYFHVQILE